MSGANGVGAIVMMGVCVSAATSSAARDAGVVVEPTITSTLSSAINLRVFLTASVVSDLSSRTMKFSF